MKELFIFLAWGCGQGKFRKEEAFELGFTRCLKINEVGQGIKAFGDQDKLQGLFPYPNHRKALG